MDRRGAQRFQDVAVTAEVADFLNDTDVDGRGGEVLRLSVLHEGVEKSVCAGIVGLAPLTLDAGTGAEKEEEVERSVLS